jgi:hypothetical protein
MVRLAVGGCGRMAESLRVLVANEPRAYRDVQGGMLRELCPLAEVHITEPWQIPAEFDSFRPHLVMCSELTDTIKDRAFAWVLLYPDDANLAVACVDDRQWVIQRVSMEDLVGVVEEAARALGIGRESGLRLVAEEGPGPYSG